MCAKLEAELVELDEKDRDEMLKSMGLSEPAMGPLARSAVDSGLHLSTVGTLTYRVEMLRRVQWRQR